VFAENLTEVPSPKIDEASLQQTFAVVDRARGTSLGSGASQAKPMEAIKSISILPVRRAQNIEILLARLPVPFNTLKDWVLRLDERCLAKPEMLDALADVLPNDSEVAAFKELPASDVPKLATIADVTVHALIPQLPRLAPRLQILRFMSQFPPILDGFHSRLARYFEACENLCTSKMFSGVLNYVLAIGNAMNKGKGSIRGFRLSSLLLLRDLKSADGSTNLLRFLVATVVSRAPELCQFGQELQPLEAVKAEKLDIIKKEISESSAQLKDIQALWDREQSYLNQEVVSDSEEEKSPAGSTDMSATSPIGSVNSSASLPPTERTRKFIEMASMRMSEVEEELQELERVVDVTISFFGENAKQTSIEDVFATARQFVVDFAKEKNALDAETKKK
jgi:hypothetical protein